MGISLLLLQRQCHPLQCFSLQTETETKGHEINSCGTQKTRKKNHVHFHARNRAQSSSCRKNKHCSQRFPFVLSFVTAVTLILTFASALLPYANCSSSSLSSAAANLSESNAERNTTFTSTVRPWPSHKFLREVISNSSDSDSNLNYTLNLNGSSLSESTLNNYNNTNTKETSSSLSQSALIIPDHHHHHHGDPIHSQSNSNSQSKSYISASSELPLDSESDSELPFPSSTKLPYSSQNPAEPPPNTKLENNSKDRNKTKETEIGYEFLKNVEIFSNVTEIQNQNDTEKKNDTVNENQKEEVKEDLQLERLFLNGRDESSEKIGETETEKRSDDDPLFWVAETPKEKLYSTRVQNKNQTQSRNKNRTRTSNSTGNRRQKSRTTVETTGELPFRVAGVKKGSSAGSGNRNRDDILTPEFYARLTGFENYDQKGELHSASQTRWRQQQQKLKLQIIPPQQNQNYENSNLTRWHLNNNKQNDNNKIPGKHKFKQSLHPDHDYVSDDKLTWWTDEEEQLFVDSVPTKSPNFTQLSWPYSQSQSQSHSTLNSNLNSPNSNFLGNSNSNKNKKIRGKTPTSNSNSGSHSALFLPSRVSSSSTRFPIITSSSILGFPPITTSTSTTTSTISPLSGNGGIFPIIIATPGSNLNLNPNPDAYSNYNYNSNYDSNRNPNRNPNPSSSTPASAVFISISTTTPRPFKIISNQNQISAFHWGSSGSKNPDLNSNPNFNPNSNPGSILILDEAGLIPVKLAIPPQYSNTNTNTNSQQRPIFVPTAQPLTTVSTIIKLSTSTQSSNSNSNPNFQNLGPGTKNVQVKVTGDLGVNKVTTPKTSSKEPTTIWYKPVINHNYVRGSKSGSNENTPMPILAELFPEGPEVPGSEIPDILNPGPDPVEPDVSPEMEMDASQNSEFSATYSNSNSKSKNPPSPPPPSYMDHLLNWSDQEDDQPETTKSKPNPKTVTTTTTRTTRRPKVWTKVKNSFPKTNSTPKKRGRKRPTTTSGYNDTERDEDDSTSGSDSTSDSESNSNSAGDENETENENENENDDSSAEETQRVLFKLWDYSNGSLRLNNQREIPSWILKGYEDRIESKNMVLNLRELPSEIQRIVTDDILKRDLDSDVIESDEKNSRHAVMDEEEEDGQRQHYNLNAKGHWEQLAVSPSGQGSTAFAFKRRPGFSPNKQRRPPINLNYVLWDSLKSGSQMSDDDNREKKPHDFLIQQNQDEDPNQAHLQNYLHYLMRPDPSIQDATWSKVEKYIKKQQTHAPYSPIIDVNHLDNFPATNSFPGTKFEDQDISNVVAVSLILSHLKKLQEQKTHIGQGQGQSSPNFSPMYPQPALSTPSTFTMSTPYRDLMDMNMDPMGITPPQKDPTWDAIRPVLQHMIYNQNFSFLLPNPPSSTPITFTTMKPKYTNVHANDRVQDFDFTSTSDSHAVLNSGSGSGYGSAPAFGYSGHQILQNAYPSPSSNRNPTIGKRRRRPNRQKQKLNYHTGTGLPKPSTPRPKIKRNKKVPSTTSATYYDDAEDSDTDADDDADSDDAQDEPPGSALLGETDESSDDYTKTLLTTIAKKKLKKKLKKKKKGYENFGFNFDIGMDLAEILKRKLIALLALKYAPLAVLLAAMLGPILLLCYPWLLDSLRSKFKKGRGYRRRNRGKKKKYEYFDDDLHSYEEDDHDRDHDKGHDPYHPQIYPYRHAYPVYNNNDPYSQGSTSLPTGLGPTGLGHTSPSGPQNLGKPKGNIEIHHHFHGDQVTPDTFQPSSPGSIMNLHSSQNKNPHPITGQGQNQNLGLGQGQLLGHIGQSGQSNVHNPTGYSISPAMYIESGGQFHDRESITGFGPHPDPDNQYADSEFTPSQYHLPTATTPIPSLFNYAQPSSDADNYMKRIRDIGRNLGKLIGSKISDQKNQEAMSLIFDSKKDAINQLLEKWKLLQSSPFTPQMRDSDEEFEGRRRRDTPTFRKRGRQKFWSFLL